MSLFCKSMFLFPPGRSKYWHSILPLAVESLGVLLVPSFAYRTESSLPACFCAVVITMLFIITSYAPPGFYPPPLAPASTLYAVAVIVILQELVGLLQVDLTSYVAFHRSFLQPKFCMACWCSTADGFFTVALCLRPSVLPRFSVSRFLHG